MGGSRSQSEANLGKSSQKPYPVLFRIFLTLQNPLDNPLLILISLSVNLPIFTSTLPRTEVTTIAISRHETKIMIQFHDNALVVVLHIDVVNWFDFRKQSSEKTNIHPALIK